MCGNARKCDHVPQFLVAGLFFNKLYYGLFKSKVNWDLNTVTLKERFLFTERGDRALEWGTHRVGRVMTTGVV